jgi:hypothetical protein
MLRFLLSTSRFGNSIQKAKYYLSFYYKMKVMAD